MVPQAAWMENVLQNNPNKWTILTLHHPIFSAAVKRDNPKVREALLPLVDKYKIDMVLQGHDHTYGRSALITSGTVTGQGESGTVYVVTVSGPKQYDLTTSETRALFDRVAEDTMLYQTIRIDGDAEAEAFKFGALKFLINT
jgi:3',5'-cyclic AMP phosphodiesterase CpdA